MNQRNDIVLGREGAIAVQAAVTKLFRLEDGLEIQFTDPGCGYESGDYWQIAVRANGRLPKGDIPARSTQHNYAPLALISVTRRGKFNVLDCRRIISPTALMEDRVV